MPKVEKHITKIEKETLLALTTHETVTGAAKALGISRQSLYERIQRYGLTEKLNNIRTIAQAELYTGASKAARNLISKIDSDDENISMKATTETLDRIGLTKPDKGVAPTVQFNQIQINDRKEFFNE